MMINSRLFLTHTVPRTGRIKLRRKLGQIFVHPAVTKIFNPKSILNAQNFYPVRHYIWEFLKRIIPLH